MDIWVHLSLRLIKNQKTTADIPPVRCPQCTWALVSLLHGTDTHLTLSDNGKLFSEVVVLNTPIRYVEGLLLHLHPYS